MPSTLDAATRQRIRAILEQHGVRNPRLFGSRARGDHKQVSDLDLLITLDPDRSLLDRIAAAQDLSDLLGIPVDLVNERALRGSIKEHILREAVVL